MKGLRTFSITAVFGLTLLLAASAQDEPVNKTCPVKGKPAKASKTSVYKGKTIGFC